jgi:hypothetical protein
MATKTKTQPRVQGQIDPKDPDQWLSLHAPIGMDPADWLKTPKQIFALIALIRANAITLDEVADELEAIMPGAAQEGLVLGQFISDLWHKQMMEISPAKKALDRIHGMARNSGRNDEIVTRRKAIICILKESASNQLAKPRATYRKPQAKVISRELQLKHGIVVNDDTVRRDLVAMRSLPLYEEHWPLISKE